MFVIAQAECDLIKKRLDPQVQLTYQPDPVNDTAEILIKLIQGADGKARCSAEG
jgi:hypothetical protein